MGITVESTEWLLTALFPDRNVGFCGEKPLEQG